MSWLDSILEAGEEEVQDIIAKAVNAKDAQGIEDINAAGTDLLGNDVSNDPDELVYDKVSSYSQYMDWDDDTSGTVDTDILGTKTKVKKGNETPQVSESYFTEDELRQIYSECVADVIRENADEINEKYNRKISKAKEWKAKKMAALKKKEAKAKEKAKKKSVEEAADIDGMLEDIFSSF